jgi:tetratricopeptide (TPR) repeat protein
MRGMNLVSQVCSQCGFENPRAFRACAACGSALGAARKTGRSYLDGQTGDQTIVSPVPGADAPHETHDSQPAPPHEDIEPPLVGQADVSSAIHEAFTASLERGLPTLVVLEGGSGSGRSRLLFHAAELAARIAPNVRVHLGACRDGDATNAPFSRVLLERFGVTPASSPQIVRGQIAMFVADALQSADAIGVGETSHLLGHFAGVPFPDSPFLIGLDDKPAELRRRQEAALKRLFEGDARQRPTLLLLDNMHFAENDAWLHLGVVLSAEAPITVVLTGDPGIAERAQKLAAAGGIVVGPIAPLSEGDVGSMLHILLPTLTEAPEPLVAALTHRSRGNPSALRELVFALVEAKLFTKTDDGLVVDMSKLEGGSLPVNIEDAIRARLMRLDDLERATIDRAAICGDVAHDRAILAMMRSERPAPAASEDALALWPDDDDEAALEHALLRLEEKGFLLRLEQTEVPGSHEYRFVHGETRHFVYRQLSDKVRVQRHATVAHWITTTIEIHRDGVPAMTAPHLEKALLGPRAGRAYLEAAKDEHQKMHTQSAMRFVEKALELLDVDDITRRIDALHLLGSLLSTLGRYEESMREFSEMLEMSYRLGARGKGGAALNRIARVHRMRGEDERARIVLVRALGLFRGAFDLRGVAATLDDLAQVERLRGDLEAATNAANEALAIRRNHGDQRGEAVSLTTLAGIEFSRGNLDAAEKAARASLKIREEIGDRAGMTTSLNHLGALASERGDLDTAETCWRQALQEARKMADRRTQSFVLNNLGEALVRANVRIPEAREVLSDARQLAHDLGDKRVIAEVERNLGLALLKLDDDDAEATVVRALALAEEYGGKEVVAQAHHAIGTLRSRTLFDQTGAVDRRAEDAYLVAIDAFRELGNEKECARTLAELGLHVLERGDTEGAKERMREARSIMRKIGLPDIEKVDETLRSLG